MINTNSKEKRDTVVLKRNNIYVWLICQQNLQKPEDNGMISSNVPKYENILRQNKYNYKQKS